MQQKHILKSFDNELASLKSALLAMLLATSGQMKSVYLVISNHDLELAKHVVKNDVKIDALHQRIVTDSVNILSLRTPVAYDLRFVFSASHISSNLERAGDNMRNIAKSVLQIAKPKEQVALKLLQMIKIIDDMLASTYMALDKEDSHGLNAIMEKDNDVDKLNDEISSLLLSVIQKVSFVELDTIRNYLLICRSLERVGDHVVNTCKHIKFITSGEIIA